MLCLGAATEAASVTHHGVPERTAGSCAACCRGAAGAVGTMDRANDNGRQQRSLGSLAILPAP